jgi:hypothetical protein
MTCCEQDATFEDGLLQIDLQREVPEAMKPKRVEIRSGKTLQDNKYGIVVSFGVVDFSASDPIPQTETPAPDTHSTSQPGKRRIEKR